MRRARRIHRRAARAARHRPAAPNAAPNAGSADRQHGQLPVGSVQEDNLGRTRRAVRHLVVVRVARDHPTHGCPDSARAGLADVPTALERTQAVDFQRGGGGSALQTRVRRFQRGELLDDFSVRALLLRQRSLGPRELRRLVLELILHPPHRRLHLALRLRLPALLSLSLLVPKLVRGERLSLARGEPASLHVASQRVPGVVQRLEVIGQGVPGAEALVASREGAREGPLVRVRALVRDEELALVELLLAPVVRARETRFLAAVVLANVLGEVLLPCELLSAARVRAHHLGLWVLRAAALRLCDRRALRRRGHHHRLVLPHRHLQSCGHSHHPAASVRLELRWSRERGPGGWRERVRKMCSF